MSNSGVIESFGAKKNAGDENEVPDAGLIQVDTANLLRDAFPPSFLLGCGTSAVQIEGGYNADGKGPSVWDTLCIEKPEGIDDRSTCFVACDSYNKYAEDVKALKEMGCNSYKFSISWSRILPNGDLSVINEKGINYYNNLIDALRSNGITPVVVLWHFDLPSALKTSWTEENILSHFVNYARVCFKAFGDRVKYWLTINEPWIYTMAAYDLQMFPPFLNEPESMYVVLHNMIKAHALAYRMYEAEFKADQNGKIGISLDCWGFEPATDSEADKEAVKTSFLFKFGFAAHPLIFGDYPECLRKRVDMLSKTEGRETSRLPVIDPELSKLLKGAVDFFGLNHYTCMKVSANGDGIPEGVSRVVFSKQTSISLAHDDPSIQFFDPKWPGSQTWWLKYTPHALRPLLRMIRDTYGNPEVMITENGIPDAIGNMHDVDRANYFTAYINETLKAVKLDGCNVTGYIAWGLLDQWEWMTGHDCTFGLVHVDLKHPDRKRTLKHSAKVIRDIYANNGFLKNQVVNL